jgi:poly(3-hydroxyalkanoate) synthetase
MDDLSSANRAGDDAGHDARTVEAVPSNWLTQFQHCLDAPAPPPTRFASQNSIAETYRTMRLRVFGKPKAGLPPTLVVAPFAVHDAGFLDLMRGHSLVQTLCKAHGGQVFVTDWRGATPDMAGFSFDTYLSELNVAIDDLGGAVNVVGVGVGGCLALVHAARFPGKIARLVLAGAPVDAGVRPSLMTRFASRTIELNELPDADAVSDVRRLAPLGASQGHERAAIETLQRNPAAFGRADLDALSVYGKWAARSLDLPGRYVRDILVDVFARNRLATGDFVALGRKIDLRRVKIPLFVLAGAMDDITPKLQALSALKLVGTAKARMRSLVAPCGHFALFVGAETLSREWRTIAGWLGASAPVAKKRAPQRIVGSFSSNAP